MPIKNRLAEMHGEITAWRHHLHQHPELMYDVHETAAFVVEKLTSAASGRSEKSTKPMLALTGRPEDAINLFEVTGEGSKRFRQEIRVAEWALDGNQPEVAQDYAWKALESAQLNRDRWYALTVLVDTSSRTVEPSGWGTPNARRSLASFFNGFDDTTSRPNGDTPITPRRPSEAYTSSSSKVRKFWRT